MTEARQEPPSETMQPGGFHLPRFGGIGWFIVRRILLGLLTLFVVSLIVFGATQALPGDPAQAILGREATPEKLEIVREQLNLNRPVTEQYTEWLSGIVTGDLGLSLANQRPVGEFLSDRIVNSAFLVLLAALISIPLSLLIGSLSAMRRDRPLDTITSIVTLALAALPEFVIGVALILLLATTVLQVFPAVSLVSPGTPVWEELDVVILPALTLVLAVSPYISRIMRGSMIEVLESDYVEMARLKGLRERVVIVRHALPNAVIPAIQVTALQLAYLAGGIVVVEFVFSFPGIGAALVDAVSNRDLPIIQALTMLIAAVYVGLNLLADILTILISPRLRTALA
jgi:peptide/nickel transport system permease protein